ncbi:MAG: hypothetical protein ACRCUJ_01055 [Phocaeicola sp.]
MVKKEGKKASTTTLQRSLNYKTETVEKSNRASTTTLKRLKKLQKASLSLNKERAFNLCTAPRGSQEELQRSDVVKSHLYGCDISQGLQEKSYKEAPRRGNSNETEL